MLDFSPGFPEVAEPEAGDDLHNCELLLKLDIKREPRKMVASTDCSRRPRGARIPRRPPVSRLLRLLLRLPA